MIIGVTTFGGDGGKSGISQYIIKLLENLAAMDHGHSIEVVVYEDEQSIFLPESADITPLCYSGNLRNPIANILWHQAALPRLCESRGFDVLFLPAGNRRLPISVRCPSVGTVHDFSSIHVIDKYDPARVFYIKHVLPFLIRRLSHVITISQSSRKDIIEYAHVPEERVSVIPQGVDHEVYYPREKRKAALQMAQKYGFHLPYILFISRIEHPGKNHVRLIRAFSRLKAKKDIPHCLVLAGSDWTRAEEVHKAAAESAFSEDIHFTGFAPAADLPMLYCGADLFVFPSLYEGFGMPVLEAMACGTPVACSNLSSMPEVAGDAGVLFDPYNEEDICRAVETVIDEASFSEELTQRGLERSRQFTWARTAALTLKVLEQVVEK